MTAHLEIETLRSLPAGSREQLSEACRLATQSRDLEVVLEALRVLGDADDGVLDTVPDARSDLVARFETWSANGPRRDPGCLRRASLLRAVRPLLGPGDIPLLEKAVSTHEMSGSSEVASDLRACALVALHDVDDASAVWHATRLVGVQSVHKPVGEDTLTAVRVLHAGGRLLPLFLYALRPEGHPAVVSECLRCLTDAPAAMLDGLVAVHRETTDEAISLGLVELLVGHDAWRDYRDVVLGLVRQRHADAELHYTLLTAIVVGRRRELVDGVVEMARLETDDGRLRNYVAALSLRSYDDDIAAIVAELEERL